MGAKYTEAQKKATGEYMKTRHTLRVVVTNEEKEQIQNHALQYDNGSMNAFIKRSIKETIERDKVEDAEWFD